jgi:hypothetical protein
MRVTFNINTNFDEKNKEALNVSGFDKTEEFDDEDDEDAEYENKNGVIQRRITVDKSDDSSLAMSPINAPNNSSNYENNSPIRKKKIFPGMIESN